MICNFLPNNQNLEIFLNGSFIGKKCQNKLYCDGKCNCIPSHTLLNDQEINELHLDIQNSYNNVVVYKNDNYKKYFSINTRPDTYSKFISILNNNKIDYDVLIYLSLYYTTKNEIILKDKDIDIYILLTFLSTVNINTRYVLPSVNKKILNRLKNHWFSTKYKTTPEFTDWFIVFNDMIYFKNSDDLIFYKMSIT